MRSPNRHALRLLGIALTAILLGGLAPAGASACPPGGRGRVGETARTCCTARAEAGACCCAAPVAEGPGAAASASVDEARSAPTCPCRVAAPVAPSREPERRGSERAPASSHWLSVERSDRAVALHALRAFDLRPTGHPPRSPLYLRLTHLLI